MFGLQRLQIRAEALRVEPAKHAAELCRKPQYEPRHELERLGHLASDSALEYGFGLGQGQLIAR